MSTRPKKSIDTRLAESVHHLANALGIDTCHLATMAYGMERHQLVSLRAGPALIVCTEPSRYQLMLHVRRLAGYATKTEAPKRIAWADLQSVANCARQVC